MKEITKALSNKVYYDEHRNIIIKKYSFDEFKRLYGNQELKVLTKLGIKVKTIKDGEIVLDYIEHEEFDDNNITYMDLMQVATALDKLHKIDPSGLQRPGFPNVSNELGFVDNKFDFQIYTDAMKILESGEQVILHNDVVEGNLLKINGKIQLIDFEYSGVGNYIFDIASFITERRLTEDQIDKFIELYPRKVNRDHLLIVCIFLQSFWGKWAEYKFKVTGKEIYKEIAEYKLEEYIKLTKKIG